MIHQRKMKFFGQKLCGRRRDAYSRRLPGPSLIVAAAGCHADGPPVVDLSADETTALIQGRSVPFALQQQGLVRLYAPGNDFIGLAKADAGQLVPRRLCNTADRAAHARE
jgi:hypothetical protein